MNATVKTQPQALPTLQEAPQAAPAPYLVPGDAFASLRVIRGRIGELKGDLSILAGHQARCEGESAKVAAFQTAQADARSALEELHAKRIGGGAVGDKEIDAAEEALDAATSAFSRSERAAQGGKIAAAKYAAEAATVNAQIQALCSQARTIFAHMLAQQARESMEKQKRVVDEFARGAHLRHHAEIAAIAKVAQELGITGLPFTHFNQNSALLQVPTTPTHEKYLDVFCAVELGPEIQARAAIIANDLRGML